MPVLPDFDAIGLEDLMMFEKSKPFNTSRAAVGAGRPDEKSARQSARRAGDALRAVEWSELTARLNAARDLRLLLRTESQGAIEAVAASFGDAAASYFALLDDGEPGVNLDGLGQSKVLGAMPDGRDATRPAKPVAERSANARRGDAREMQ